MPLFPDDLFVLADIALEVARRDPDRLAVVEPAGRDRSGRRRYHRHTYRDLSRDAEAVAVGLREIGIRERTRTVFMAPPSYGACVAGLALSRVGATMIWIDPSVGYRNVAERLRRVDPEAFVGIPLAHIGRVAFGWGPRLLERTVVIGEPGFPGAHRLEKLRRPAPERPPVPAVGPDDPASIFYTTGSTGPAKPALYLHRNLCAVYRLAHRTWGFDDSPEIPIDMPVFPAFFSIGLSAGGTVVVPPIDFVRQRPATVDPAALLEVIRDQQVSSLFASPVILENLARHAAARGLRAPSLRRVIGGGAPLFADVLEPLRALIGEDGEVHADYGATEALPATELAARDALGETAARTARGEGLCVGRPFDGVELKIVRITDGPIEVLEEAEELGVGEIGEVLVRGPHVSPAYFGDEASTRRNKVLDPDGAVWHRLGDAGRLDEAGRLWCYGRVGQRVELQDGSVLFPLACEPIFDAHPRVGRSGLAGVRVGGACVPVICVELAEPVADPAPLRGELEALAARHPQTRGIRHVLVHPGLPVDSRHNSKIERPALARWAERQLRRAPSPRLVAAAALLLAIAGCNPTLDDPGMAASVDAGVEIGDAGPPPGDDPGVDLGEPIVVPPEDLESWVWIPVPEMRCADDSPAGVGVNFTDKSDNLVIWFQGNGVCYDLKSCTLFQGLLVGMGDDPLSHLFWDQPSAPYAGLFDRNEPTNPFRNDSFVVLPHCTLDGHSADKTSTYPPLPTYHQRGYRNATVALERVAATFPGASRVVVAGFSAGAIGATANYHKIATTFEALGQPPPLLVADSGPLLPMPHLSSVAIREISAGWGLDDTIGPWCPACATEGPNAVYRTIAELHPGMRGSVISSYADSVTTNLYRLLTYNINLLDTRLLERGLRDFAARTAAEEAAVAPSRLRQLYFPGDRHGALVLPLSSTPGLQPFLEAQLAGDPGWSSVIP